MIDPRLEIPIVSMHVSESVVPRPRTATERERSSVIQLLFTQTLHLSTAAYRIYRLELESNPPSAPRQQYEAGDVEMCRCLLSHGTEYPRSRVVIAGMSY